MTNKNTNRTGSLNTEILRFTTAGSVDDGKSTLIGRLLYDSKSIFEDQMEAIELSSKRRGEEHVNLALLTDGLKAEREQGITIDVAYRYFATPKRKFIIADTPGHIQYTRNMVTGASTANLALILVDARQGIMEQTIRHSYIATLLQIPHIVLCINKMDLVGYSQEVYENIKTGYKEIAEKLHIHDLHVIPISALLGDNVVNLSKNMPWFTGESLLSLLETIEIRNDRNYKDARFPVQFVIRPMTTEFHDYRGYAGQIVGGQFFTGETVKVLPSGVESKIASIDTFDGSLDSAQTPQSITITLADDVDISRGDMLVKPDNMPNISQEINLMVCWFNDRPMTPRGKYVVRHNTNEVRCIITGVEFKMDINSLEKNTEDKQVKMNDIAHITIKTSKPIFFDSYNKNRYTGSLVLIDEVTNETVAGGMIM